LGRKGKKGQMWGLEVIIQGVSFNREHYSIMEEGQELLFRAAVISEYRRKNHSLNSHTIQGLANTTIPYLPKLPSSA